MRKHLIGTILVLAALAACNKEIDTQTPAIVDPVEETPAGKVTLTFKATIGEETRTVYANDKTASWAAGDKISVRVTDGTNFETAEFSTTDGETFTGQVTNRYTTIVSGVYPANDNHVFSGGSVQSVYLKDSYDLGTANDGGIALPMVGEMKKKDGVDTFTFHHICGALKIEIVDIFNALTFTTAGETITGGFELDEETGRIKMPENGTSSTVTFNYGRLSTNPTVGERKNRTFYIPVPDGTLTAGATMALKNSSDKVVFEKTTSGNIAFDSKVIKRLPAIELATPARWTITVNEVDAGNPFSILYSAPTGTRFIRSLLSTKAWKDTYNESVAQFIEKNILGNNGYTTSYTYTPTNNIETYYGTNRIMIMCGYKLVSGERQATLEYCIIDYSFYEPSQAYLDWIGKWTVSDGTNNDTWTIARKQANQTYTITGIAGRTNNHVTADFDNGELSLASQLLPEKYSSKDFYLLARGSTGGIYRSVGRHIMSMSMSNNTVVVTPDLTNSPGGYGFYAYTVDTDSYGYVVRRSFGSDINITMERVTE